MERQSYNEKFSYLESIQKKNEIEFLQKQEEREKYISSLESNQKIINEKLQHQDITIQLIKGINKI